MKPEDEIDVGTIASAEKLARLAYSEPEREQLRETLPGMLRFYDRRRRVALPNALGPALRFVPSPPANGAGEPVAAPARAPAPALPADDEDIAFAPLPHLAGWLEAGQISSTRLTELYLARLARFGPELHCVVTATPERARKEAWRADQEIAAGRYRGPLHGVPYGVKDLLDTADIPTTWGAAPYRDRVPARDAVVVERLSAAGAVLLGKLSLGALAMGDVWFGGRTRNPWAREQGASGSSAGSGAAVAAGLVGFAIGSETLGSIVEPALTCGCVGLRPSFGRVPRTGAMALAWSLDKLGPMARAAEDTALVLGAIHGADSGDADSVDAAFRFERDAASGPLRIGYLKDGLADGGEQVLGALRQLGHEAVEVALPELPYETIIPQIQVEAAAAFEELTLTDRDDELGEQGPLDWPNALRTARLIPAVEYLQMLRVRTRIAEAMDVVFADVDAMVATRSGQLLQFATNATGHPSLTLPTGLAADATPRGVTLYGRLWDEARLVALGMALEAVLDFRDQRPPLG